MDWRLPAPATDTRALVVRIVQPRLHLGHAPGRKTALRVADHDPRAPERGHRRARRGDRVNDVARLSNFIHVLMRARRTQPMIIGGHDREPGPHHGHQALLAIGEVLLQRRRAHLRDARGAVSPRDDRPAAGRCRTGGDQHDARGRDVLPLRASRVIQNSHGLRTGRDRIAGKTFLAQQRPGLRGRERRRFVKGRRRQRIGLFHFDGIGERVRHRGLIGGGSARTQQQRRRQGRREAKRGVHGVRSRHCWEPECTKKYPAQPRRRASRRVPRSAANPPRESSWGSRFARASASGCRRSPARRPRAIAIPSRFE